MPQATVSPLLAIHDLSVQRNQQPILRNISWTMHSAEHWVILGANGSGKTSLLMALTGYLTPTSGSIELLGQIYGEAHWPELRRKVGIVSSSVRQRIDGTETPLEILVAGRYAMINQWGRIKRQDRQDASDILAKIEASHLTDRPWEVLSQGERQRILIGRALMADLKLLILDEPCAGLDPVAREQFLAFIERLAAEEDCPGLIFVTHHVEEIRPCFSKALLLSSGSVLASGPLSRTLSSHNLSQAFGASLTLSRRGNRYALKMTQPS